MGGLDAGMVTSDAGALLLGATDRAIKMMERFASCFHDGRRSELIEHEHNSFPLGSAALLFTVVSDELQAAFDAVECALEDEKELAKQDDQRTPETRTTVAVWDTNSGRTHSGAQILGLEEYRHGQHTRRASVAVFEFSPNPEIPRR
jgi:hypothetical protein